MGVIHKLMTWLTATFTAMHDTSLHFQIFSATLAVSTNEINCTLHISTSICSEIDCSQAPSRNCCAHYCYISKGQDACFIRLQLEPINHERTL